jgi:curved DNA-binding protein CbpA
MLQKQSKIPACLQVMGFSEFPENEGQIKARYRQLAKNAHPDKGGTFSDFVKLRKAYEESIQTIKRKGAKQ